MIRLDHTEVTSNERIVGILCSFFVRKGREMKREDFEFCEYVEWNMCFVTYHEFCNKRKVIKKMYRDLDRSKQQFYKWYIYANLLVDVSVTRRETYQNAIWEYLNQDDTKYQIMLIKLRNKLKQQF